MLQIEQIKANVLGLIGALHRHAKLINEPKDFGYVLAREASTDSPAPIDVDLSTRTVMDLRKVQATLCEEAEQAVSDFEQRTGYGQVRSDWASLLSESTRSTLGAFVALFISSEGKILDSLQLTSEETRSLSEIFKALAQEEPPNFNIELAMEISPDQPSEDEPIIDLKINMGGRMVFTAISEKLNQRLAHKQCCIT